MPIDPVKLADISFFKGFSSADLESISKLMEEQHLDDEEILLRQAEATSGFYVLLEGELAVYRALPDLREICLARLKPGDIAGFVSLIDKRPCTATVRASEPCLVARMDSTDFDLLFGSSSSIGLRFQRALARDIVHALKLTNHRFTRAASLPSHEFNSLAHLEALSDYNSGADDQ